MRLLTTAEKYLRKKGIRKIRLEVAVTNQAALKLYENTGFKKIVMLRHYFYFDYEGTRNAYRMVKELS